MFSKFITVTLLLHALSLTSAEYLAVTEHKSSTLLGGTGAGAARCVDGAVLYRIESFASHPDAIGSECGYSGAYAAVSNQGRGEEMEGCNGGYSGGWSVCITSYGGNVHNGRGQHQRCVTDDSTIFNCPSGICYQSVVRKLKCQGVWHRDA